MNYVNEMVASIRYEQAKRSNCEIKLDYEKVEPVNKRRCPYFYGSQEYGNNLSFALTFDSVLALEKKYKFQLVGEGYRLNLFENGVITISTLWYNGRNEEWEEEEIYKFENEQKEEIISYIDYMLAISPIARNTDNLMLGNYQEALKFIKKY